MTTNVESDGTIILPDTTRDWILKGATLRVRVVKGPKAMLSPAPDADRDEDDVVTVNDSGGLLLPDFVRRALDLSAGDAIEIWDATGSGLARKLFVAKKIAETRDAEQKTVPSQEPETHTLPHYAERQQQRRTWGPSPRFGSDKYDLHEASLERLSEPGDRHRGEEVWAATSGDTRGEGTTIPEALEALRDELQSALSDFYFRADIDPIPKAELRLTFPREVEDVLTRFREKWFAIYAEDREGAAIRPAAQELAELGLAHSDISWILELPPELVEAYVTDPTAHLGSPRREK